jgi:predicted unusual protein kinase regulating ubiquinone biosynthesis (AarF/ABC1/UbiB family)
VIDKNIEIIRHQTNFQEEVENIIKVKNNCANLKYVKIPEVFAEVTQKYPDFIMMEYIDGVKINQVCEEDYVGFSKQVLKFGLVTTIVHGVTHGDLHSGNILFIKDASDEKYPHKIGVIDFGIIFEIENAYKETLFEFLTQLFDRPPRQSVIHLLNSVIIKDNDIIYKIPQKDYVSIVNIGVELFTEALHNAQNVNQIQLYKFMAKIKEYLNKKELMDLGIQPSDNFVKMQLVLAMAHGVTLTLCKNNFVSLMDDVLNELFHTKMILEE